nr:MAG TPA: hypothetical protein [Bacteriophage sp.]
MVYVVSYSYIGTLRVYKILSIIRFRPYTS